MATPTNPDQGLPSVEQDIITAARWEWFRLSRRVAFWAIIGLMAVQVAVSLGWLLVMTPGNDGPALRPYTYPDTAAGVLSAVGPFLAVVLASISYGGDFGWGTWRPLVARGIHRWQAGLAKLLLLAAALLVFWTASGAVSALVGVAAGSEESAAVDIYGSDGWGETAVKFGAAWLVALAYLGLGAVLTTAGRSTAFGLGVGVGVILFELAVYPLAGLAGKAFDIPVGDYTLWTLWGVTGGLVNSSDESSPSRWVFLGATLGYGGLFWGLTLLGLSRRDLGSGNG